MVYTWSCLRDITGTSFHPVPPPGGRGAHGKVAAKLSSYTNGPRTKTRLPSSRRVTGTWCGSLESPLQALSNEVCSFSVAQPQPKLRPPESPLLLQSGTAFCRFEIGAKSVKLTKFFRLQKQYLTRGDPWEVCQNCPDGCGSGPALPRQLWASITLASVELQTSCALFWNRLAKGFR